MGTDLADQVQRWIGSDPDPATRGELEDLLVAGATDELAGRFSGPLEFGTAGIRGIVGAGETRMNRAVIIRTTKGLADWLQAQGHPGPVILGRDARLSSWDFAGDTAAVLGAAGFVVRYFPTPVPTPLVAYACRVLEAAAGIVITASHNPPEYNGYKVYDRNAAQIIPPVDAEIAAAIAAAPPAIEIARIEDPFGGLDDSVLPAPGWIFESYLEEVFEIRPAIDRDTSLRIVHTPLHGVGGGAIREALTEAGYEAVAQVPEQTEPDGHFPTVAFPNPEEEGALDLAQALAHDNEADLIIANDPDVDRLAVGLPLDGEYRLLTGNQIGVLLGDYLLEHTRAAQPLVVNSIVSSPMLGIIAAAHGAESAQTLTGFKWICNAALDLAAAGQEFVFGYEEALGYSVGTVVRDKDGIGAAVHFCDLAAHERARGRTVWDRLGDLYSRHGLWVSSPKNFTRPGADGLAEIAAAMDRLAVATPSAAGGRQVLTATDYRQGADERPRWLPEAAVVELRFVDGRALIRPSGTEPKLKIYVDLRADLNGDDWRVRQAGLAAEAAAVGSDIGDFLGFD